MTEAIVALILAAVGSIVFIIRGEGRTNSLHERIVRLEKDHDNLSARVHSIDSELVKELTQIKVTLAKIEGVLQALQKE